MKKDYLRELPTFFLPNTGNMGIPICLFAYGKLGMGIAAAISSLVVLLHFTLNIFLANVGVNSLLSYIEYQSKSFGILFENL